LESAGNPLIALSTRRFGVVPTKTFKPSTDEMSAESLENQRVWQSLPVAEQIRIYEVLAEARKRLNAPIETTATVTSGPEPRNDVEPPADDAEHSET
jgi:hypothetical protein